MMSPICFGRSRQRLRSSYATRDYPAIRRISRGGELILSLLNPILSLVLISVLFAAIYIAGSRLEWRDVAVGAVVTAILVLSRSSWPS